MKCKHCGYENPKGAKYCCQCGSSRINETPENELYELFSNPRTRDNLVKNLCKYNLSDLQYKVVESHFFKGLSYEQIAENLNKTYAVVKQAKGYALSKLRNLSVIELEHYGDIMTMRDRLYVQNEIDKQRILFLERLLSDNGISYNEENVSISILHLPSRTETSLKEAGIYYLSQLTSLTFQDVRKIKGIGYVGESEIWKSLDAIGLEFNDEYDEIDLEDEDEDEEIIYDEEEDV